MHVQSKWANRYVPLSFWLLPCLTVVTAEDPIVVTFRMHSPGLANETDVFITGNLRELGSWNPASVRMDHVGDHVWSYQLRIVPPREIEYKYTLGSWSREGADATGRPLANLELSIQSSIVQKDMVSFWTDRKLRKPRGQITGQVRYHRQLGGEGLRLRDVVVWLPPDYDKPERSDRRYPVLYMHDGQNLVDPKTSAFGVDWEVDETCTKLIGEGSIPPLIVVGIYNTPDRSREYMPGEKGTAYINFVTQTLKPLIDQNYRTRASRADTFVGGSSAGGLSAFMMVWERSDIFSRAICMSPALRYQRSDGTTTIDYVTRVRQSDRPAHDVFFYIDNGGDRIDKKLQGGVDAMSAALREKGLKDGQHFQVLVDSGDPHNESAWASRFPKAIKSLLVQE